MVQKLSTILFLYLICTTSLMSVSRYELQIDSCLLEYTHQVAVSQVGVTEATGNNDGVQIKKYLAVTGLPEGYPYCAAGLSWCAHTSAIDSLDSNKSFIPFPMTAGSQVIYDHARKHGVKTSLDPQRYDFFTWRKKDSYKGHIGMIDSVKRKGWVKTIEFNTSPPRHNGSQRDGDGVWYKNRNLIHPIGRLYVRGFIGWDKQHSSLCQTEYVIPPMNEMVIPENLYRPDPLKTEIEKQAEPFSLIEWVFKRFREFI